MTNHKIEITGVILAGGKSRRMHGVEDKGLLKLGEKPMVEIIFNIFAPQVKELIINANSNHDEYMNYGCKVVQDKLPNYCGPLSGMASVLEGISTPYMATVPCDTPFIPNILIKRLEDSIVKNNADIAVVNTGDRIHPVFCLMKKQLLSSLQKFLNQGERKIDKWFTQHSLAMADFSDIPYAFDNINTLEDSKSAIKKLRNNVNDKM